MLYFPILIKKKKMGDAIFNEIMAKFPELTRQSSYSRSTWCSKQNKWTHLNKPWREIENLNASYAINYLFNLQQKILEKVSSKCWETIIVNLAFYILLKLKIKDIFRPLLRRLPKELIQLEYWTQKDG